AAEELARAHGQQGAVSGPHSALAGNEAGARARAAGLGVEPRFVGPAAMERDGKVDAGRDVAGVYVQARGGGPAEGVEQDQGAARVEPRGVEGRSGYEAVPVAGDGRGGFAVLPIVDPGRGPLVEVVPELEHRLD